MNDLSVKELYIQLYREASGSRYVQLPKDLEFNEDQKYLLKKWESPICSTSTECSKCECIYSSGYLKLCSKDIKGKETFCGFNDPRITEFIKLFTLKKTPSKRETILQKLEEIEEVVNESEQVEDNIITDYDILN